MFKRLWPIGGLVAALSLAVGGLTAANAVQFQRQFETTTARASFASGLTFTFLDVSRGVRVFETDGQESVQEGTFVTINIFSKGSPGRFEFGCFKVADGAFTGGLAGATLNVTVGPGSGNCTGSPKGGPQDQSILGPGGPSGLSQALAINITWSPLGAVNHDTSSFEHSCLDFAFSSQSSTDSVRAQATGTINGVSVGAGAGFKPFAALSTEQGEFGAEGTPAPSCGFGFKG